MKKFAPWIVSFTLSVFLLVVWSNCTDGQRYDWVVTDIETRQVYYSETRPRTDIRGPGSLYFRDKYTDEMIRVTGYKVRRVEQDGK